MTAATDIETIGREDFIQRRFRYRAGEHVTLIARTTGGKTTLANELLAQVSRPKLPCVAMVMKPRDAVVMRWAKENRFRIVRQWPPIPSPFHPKPPGYVLWPKHTYDPERDDPWLRYEFRRAMLDSYKRGNRILFADEAAGLVTELGLARELKAIWMRGASMNCGLWAATQRPVDIPLHAYNGAHHLFLGYEPDKRGRDRFNEIGGVNGKLVSDVVMSLEKFQWLYIRRDDGKMCVIDKN